MKLVVLIFALLCIWLRLAMGVINNGFITFDPVPGASRYTLWRAVPGQTKPSYLASFQAPPFQVSGPIPDYSTFYVRTIMQTNDSGTLLSYESDFGFVVSPPVENGTNTLRFIGPVNALLLQSADQAIGPWNDIGLWSNTLLRLAPRTNQLLRTLRTNLPPIPQ